MNKLLLRSLPLLLAQLIGFVHVCTFHAVAQTVAPVRSANFIVAVVNSEPITNSEVQAVRQRLAREFNGRGTTPPASAQLTRQALDMLIIEKAQLQQAEEQGIKVDDDQVDQAEANVAANNQIDRETLHRRLTQEGISVDAFRKQLRNQLILSRLREREVESRIRISEQDIDRFLESQGNEGQSTPPELNIAMILLPVPENASASETKDIEDKARELARRARSGEDFAQLAKVHSQAFDKGAKGGEMGLRSAERYPELFVEAIRSLAPQGISEPVRSGAGFHILKLLERRQAAANMTVVQTRARHILLRPSAQLSRDQAVARLQGVRQQILSGKASFSRVAQEISQDGSADQGGDLGWAVQGQFVPEFEQVMNRLQPGQISDPLVSRFGVHILEVTERRKVAVPEKEQREMARAALREKRFDESHERWLEDLRGRAYVEMREAPEIAIDAIKQRP
jgi:peptidyl-prolyl cis-trans isomerase SurA